jgi:hypothetical protein
LPLAALLWMLSLRPLLDDVRHLAASSSDTSL